MFIAYGGEIRVRAQWIYGAVRHERPLTPRILNPGKPLPP
jgi:hypothetical protein